MTRSHAGLRRGVRLFLRGLAGLIALVLGLVLAVCIYLSTDSGKARLLAAIVPRLNQLLPGKFSIQKLQELRPTRLVLEGVRIAAPAGNELLSSPRLTASIDLWSLFGEQIVFTELSLEVANADVRFPMAPGTGFVSAFATLDDTAETEESSGELPRLAATRLHLEGARISLPQAPVGGSLELRQVSLDAKVALAPLRVELAHLDTQVWRHGDTQSEQLGHLSARGQLHMDQPSRLELESSLSGMDLTLSVDGNVPESRYWQDVSFDARLQLRELTTARLATLLDEPSIASTPVGPVGADLRLAGTARHIELEGTLLTAGGNASVSAMALELADLDRAHLDLAVDAERLRIQPVIESLPDWTLTTKSAASLSWPKGSPGVHLAARSDSALGGTPLPVLTLQADLAGGGIQATELRIERGLTSLAASGGWSSEGRAQLRLAGQLDLDDLRRLGVELGVALPNATGQVNINLEAARDDAGRLDAHGRLGSKKLRIESAEIQELGTSFSLAGMLPFPALRLEAKWGAAQRDSIALTPGRLRITGKPSHYAFELQSGALPLGSVAASGWFEPGATRSRLALAASGTFKEQPWQIELEPLDILPEGALHISGATVVFAAQRARLSGTYSPASAELALDFADVELGPVLAAFEIAPGLRGSYTGHLLARGTLERPRVQLELTGTRLGREHGPTLDARLKATLDAHSGVFELDSRFCESPESAKGRARLALGLRASSQFDPGAAWLTSWRNGEHNATLALQHLEHHILAELLGKPLPVRFDLQGELSLVTHQGVPELHWKGSGDVAPNPESLGRSQQALSAQLIHELNYHDGRLETSLALQDAEGQWLTGKAHAELPPGRLGRPRVADLLQDTLRPLPELIERATWDVELETAPRALGRWPLPASLAQFGASKLGARLSAHGQPQSEPRGKLEFELSGVATHDESMTCVTRDWRTSGQVEFDNGDFRARLSGYHGQDQLLEVSSEAHFELLPRLRGQAPPAPRLLVLAKVERLPLTGLPFVCERARGLLSATLRVKDPLGDTPGATLDLRIAGFSLGSPQGLDVHAEVAVDPKQLVAHGTLAAEQRVSTFELQLPVRSRDEPPGSNGDAAIHGKLALQALPLAALVPKDGPLSHVSGTATGNVQLQGTNRAPRLSGQLKLEEGAFTATALAQPLSNIDGEVSFADDVILLKKLSARDGDGQLTIDGRLKLKSKDEFDGSFELTASKFPLRQAGQVMATTSANAQVQAAWSPTVRDLRIQLKDFDTWLEGVQAGAGLALDTHPDLVVDDPALHSETSTESSASGASAPTKLSVHIDAGQQFWVRRADFAIKLSANLDIVVDEALADQPDSGVSVTGQLQFDRGYLELLGRVFDIERGGMLHFTGGTAATIDLSATYLDRRSEKTVKVQISGSATSPKLDFFLEGTRITAGEAFTAIYGTETTSSSEIEDTEAQAKAFVSALTAGAIATTLRKKLGAMAPIVMVTPGDTESSGQLRAGFEADALIPDFMRGVVTGVYLEGIISSDKSTSDGGQRDLQRGVSIDVHFPHNLFTSGRYGPDTTWSLDFGWQP